MSNLIKDKATICIINYKTLDLTRLCLRSIRKFTNYPYEVMVVDKNSRDESLEYLKSLNWIRLIERRPESGEPGGGYAHGAGLDLGLENCNTEFFISLHSDVAIRKKNWLSDLIAYFNSPAWKAPLLYLTWGSAMHFHAVVETSIHPDIILEYGIKALEAQQWELSRSFTWAIPMKGFDLATVKFLIKKPEVCPEIECYFNPDVSIVPGAESVRGKQSTSDMEDITRAMVDLEYIELDEEAVKEIVEALK